MDGHPLADPSGAATDPVAAPEHEQQCQTYRRAYKERYGVLTRHICYCERIRGEQIDSP